MATSLGDEVRRPPFVFNRILFEDLFKGCSVHTSLAPGNLRDLLCRLLRPSCRLRSAVDADEQTAVRDLDVVAIARNIKTKDLTLRPMKQP